MSHRMVFLACASALFAGVAACGSSSNDENSSSAGNGGSSSGSSGSSSGGKSAGGTSSSGGNSGSSGKGAGGTSSSSGGSSSGMAGALATGGDAGANTGGSGGSNSCPPALPPSRSPCSVPNLQCNYGQTLCNCVVMLGQPGGMSWFCGESGGTGGSGGSGGSSSPCGECAEGERCIFQAGGPGPGRFRCAQNPPCTLAGECACITGEGTCSYQNVTADAGVVELCVCDNGLD